MVLNGTFNNISFISWQSYVRDKSIKHKVSLTLIIIITTNILKNIVTVTYPRDNIYFISDLQHNFLKVS